MDPAALASLCALLARGAPAQPLPAHLNCPPSAAASVPRRAAPDATATTSSLTAALASSTARDAITRVAYAEAGNQGDSGLAAVVYTILNRVQDGRWGATVEAVVNARGQFEPVMRAGGSWRNLRPASEAERARIDTILNLALEGRLPDLTNGARFFQNAAIVAAREAAGTVSPGLTNFGGAASSARIGDHTFYAEARRGRGGGRPVVRPAASPAAPEAIFVGENRAGAHSDLVSEAGADPLAGPVILHIEPPPEGASAAPAALDPLRGMFVRPDGQTSDRGR